MDQGCGKFRAPMNQLSVVGEACCSCRFGEGQQVEEPRDEGGEEGMRRYNETKAENGGNGCGSPGEE